MEERKLFLNDFAAIFSLVLLILIFAFPMNFLWNNVLSDLFCFSHSTYWSMVGLNVFVYLISKIARA